jgi:predicted flap endonuclease-1-like 5' DNA nuclease
VVDAGGSTQSGKPDDLSVIEGIGKKMSAALVASGIDTFTRLAQSSEDDIRAAIQAAGMRFAPSVPTWAGQAEYAAKGDWDGLKDYQSTLKSGRAT